MRVGSEGAIDPALTMTAVLASHEPNQDVMFHTVIISCAVRLSDEHPFMPTKPAKNTPYHLAYLLIHLALAARPLTRCPLLSQ